MRQFRLLEPEELQTVRTYLDRLSFRDGRETAHGLARSVKNNQEIDARDPVSLEATAYLATRIMAHPNMEWLVFPKTLTRPIISRTADGGGYGRHVDASIMPDIQSRRMRTDLSFTLFLSDPAGYDGGELSIQTETGGFVDFKEAPGEIVFYSSARLHEVKPVTGGERLVCIGWVESMIYDEAARNALWSLIEVQNLLGQQVDKSSDLFQTYQRAINAMRRSVIGRI